MADRDCYAGTGLLGHSEKVLDTSSWPNYKWGMNVTSPRDLIDLIARIREAANLLIERELQRRGITGVVPAHGLIFSFLFRQNGLIPIKAIVQQSGRVKSTVTGMINTLEKHGYIFKQYCTEDGRSTLIGLTEKGMAIRQDFDEISVILENQVYREMRQDDRHCLVKLLSVIETNLKR